MPDNLKHIMFRWKMETCIAHLTIRKNFLSFLNSSSASDPKKKKKNRWGNTDLSEGRSEDMTWPRSYRFCDRGVGDQRQNRRCNTVVQSVFGRRRFKVLSVFRVTSRSLIRTYVRGSSGIIRFDIVHPRQTFAQVPVPDQASQGEGRFELDTTVVDVWYEWWMIEAWVRISSSWEIPLCETDWLNRSSIHIQSLREGFSIDDPYKEIVGWSRLELKKGWYLINKCHWSNVQQCFHST